MKSKPWLKQPQRHRQRRRRPSVWVLLMLLIGMSSLFGWVLTQAQSSFASPPVPIAQAATVGTVDVVPPGLTLAQDVYLARCATCHIGIPPAVLPSESWQSILQDSNHYGVAWEALRNPDLALAWKYARTYSRPLNPEEDVPYRIARSRYFKILHPRVEFTEPVTVNTCASCHPGVPQFNFRDLSQKWKDAP